MQLSAKDREEIIQYFVDQVEDWDLQAIIEYAQECKRERLEKLSNKALHTMYKEEESLGL